MNFLNAVTFRGRLNTVINKQEAMKGVLNMSILQTICLNKIELLQN